MLLLVLALLADQANNGCHVNGGICVTASNGFLRASASVELKVDLVSAQGLIVQADDLGGGATRLSYSAIQSGFPEAMSEADTLLVLDTRRDTTELAVHFEIGGPRARVWSSNRAVALFRCGPDHCIDAKLAVQNAKAAMPTEFAQK